MSSVLDSLIELAQIRGSIDVRCRFEGSWYVRHKPARHSGMVHIVTEGSGYMQMESGDTLLLRAGDVVFFPRIPGHILSSEYGCGNDGDVPEIRREGVFSFKGRTGKGGRLDLFCARFEYDSRAELIAGLPDMLLLNLPQNALRSLTGLLQEEAADTQYGSAVVTDALASVLLVWIVRHYLLQKKDALPAGLLTAWNNPNLHKLVQAVLDAPEYPWRVGEMAEAANMSRSGLMRLFKEKTGLSPHAFVNRIRLQQAAVLFRRSTQPVLSVALSVGFQSETHFGKAFKKQYGISPGNYRKNSGAQGGFKLWHWEI